MHRHKRGTVLSQIQIAVVRHLLGCEESRKRLHQEAPQPSLFLRKCDEILSRCGDHFILGESRESQFLDSQFGCLQTAEHCNQVVVGIKYRQPRIGFFKEISKQAHTFLAGEREACSSAATCVTRLINPPWSTTSTGRGERSRQASNVRSRVRFSIKISP